MEYPKIQSLYKRKGVEKNEDGTLTIDKSTEKHPLLVGQYALDEFFLINQWEVYEKIDGTNIRIIFTRFGDNFEQSKLEIKGRTDRADIPAHLNEYLVKTFTIEKLDETFKGSNRVVLFGEGFGPKIQHGGNYSDEVGFILFDIHCSGWWLKMVDVQAIAEKLGIPVVPRIDNMATYEVRDFVNSMPRSRFAKNANYMMEGVVCRTEPLLAGRNGHRVMFKLKCKDMETAIW